MNGILELLTTKHWMISPDFVHASRTVIEHNLNNHTALSNEEKKHPYAMVLKESAEAPKWVQFQVTEGGGKRYSYELGHMEEPFINVLTVDGPISRNGGACSYGSVELRDWLIKAANDPQCRGHVFYIDTPGGSAWAKNDFQQAIDYAHSLKQPVLAFIDGQCASAGMYLAALCDEVYYMHPKNQIGCIGVMAAFYTEKPDTTNKYTNETYREYYDPESYEKNKWYRDIEKDGDATELIEELKQLGVEFRADVQAAFPAAQDEHIHGKIFDAEKVAGILCDGQATFGDTIARAFDLYNGAAPIQRKSVTPAAPTPAPAGSPSGETTAITESAPAGSPSGESATVPAASPAVSSPENSEKPNNIIHQNPNNMKKYETIATACGVEEMVVTEEGAHLVPEMLDQLETSLANAATAQQNAEKRADDLQTQLDNAATAQKEAVDAKEKELNEAHETTVNELTAAKEKAEADLQEANKATEDAQKELETAKQTIKDQQAQIEALTHSAGGQKDPGPANNGQGAQDETPRCAMPEYDHTKTPLENARIRKAAGF